MNAISKFLCCIVLGFNLLWLTACEQVTENTQENNTPTEDPALKAKLVGQVAELGCQDTRDLITKYGGKLLPLVGDAVLEKIIDKKGKGDFCECIKPTLEKQLDVELKIENLDLLITQRENRRKLVKEIILEQRSEIVDCYKTKGSGKGVKFIEKVLNKIAKKEAGDNTETAEDNTLE